MQKYPQGLKPKSPINLFGGKARLAKKIVALFPSHQIYVEPFGGSGAVLFEKNLSSIEVYNDIDQGLVNLFSVLRCPMKSAALQSALELTPFARAEFIDASKLNKGNTLDDVERARRFLVRRRQSFNSLGSRWAPSFDAVGRTASAIQRWRKAIERLPSALKRLENVQIECRSWEEIVHATDSTKTLFYLDPPYAPSARVSGGYANEMTSADHVELVKMLMKIEGMAILSGYQCREYMPLQEAGWMRMDLKVRSFASDSRAKRVESLWISPSITTQFPAKFAVSKTQEINRQRAGALLTHSVRTSRTELAINNALKKIVETKSVSSLSEVARLTGLTARHLTRRYAHLLVDLN